MWGILYLLCSWLLLPLWPLIIAVRLSKHKEDPARWPERWGIYLLSNPPSVEGLGPVWLHAASVGEWRSLQPLLQAFWHADEKQHFIITTQTSSAAQMLASTNDPRLLHLYAPWDHPLTVAAFLRHIQPRAAIFVESEIWPHLLSAIQNRKIPAFLLNAQLSEKAAKRWQPLRGWLQKLLGCFQTILTPSDAETARLKQLGIRQAQSGISLKYAASPLTCDIADLFAWRQQLKDRPIWLAASTHAGEEEIILATHQKLKNQFPDLITVIAPRHPERCKEIVGQFNDSNVLLASDVANPPLGGGSKFAQDHIYIIDRLGELGLWFRLCPITFMGGSLVPIGGHNLIEPAQLGCAILHGPHMQSCQDVVDLLHTAHAAQPIRDADELAQTVSQLLQTPEMAKAMGDRALNTVATKQQAAHAMIADITHIVMTGSAP